MGLLDFFRRRPSPGPASAAVVEARPALPTETEGVSGTANFSGRLQVERNEKLRDQLAYGRAGSTEWGEWEEIRRTNPFVGAGIEHVCGPIADAAIEVAAAKEHPQQALAQTQADFVKWNLERLGFNALRRRIADGMLSTGFSLWEYAWEAKPHRLLGGREAFSISRFEERLPGSLSTNPWEEDSAGRLVSIRQNAPGPAGTWFHGAIPASQVLRFAWQQTGRNYAGFSAFRAVWYIAGRLQPELLRLIGVTYQREGAGVPVAFADDPKTPLTPEQRAQLAELMANLVYHENANAVLPPGWKMNWVFAGGANKGHVLDTWRELGIIVLQQVSAQQLALGTGNTGSRSVGEVHDARSMAFIRGVVAVLLEPLNELMKRVVDANWGPQEAYPQVKLTLKRPELDPKTRVEALSTAKTASLITFTTADENALREELSMAPISEAERAAAKALQPPAPPAGFPVQPPDAPGAPVRASTEWASWRPLRASETRTDWPRIDEYLAGRREAFERAVKPVVVEMLVKAAPDITAAMADGDPSEVATLKLDTSRLEEAVGAFLSSVRASGGDFARVELKKGSSERLAESRRDVLTAAAEEEDDKVAQEAEDDADEIQDAQEVALVRRMTSRLRGELETEAIDAVRTGGTGLEVVSRAVARQLETGAFRTDAGAVVARIFNVGRDEAARIVGGVSRVEYSAVLDSRVCSSCRNLDGRQADFGSSEHDALVPPNRDCDGGANCRCLLVFIPEADE